MGNPVGQQEQRLQLSEQLRVVPPQQTSLKEEVCSSQEDQMDFYCHWQEWAVEN